MARSSRRVFSRVVLLAAGLLCLPGTASVACARKQAEVRYGFERVWNTTLRFLRVDMRFAITDRDPETGYVLFEYVDHGKRYPGSVELLRVENARPPSTKLVVQVQGMPSYVEQMLLDRLSAKLRAELGDPISPPEPERPKKPEPPPAEPPAEPVPTP